MDTAILLSIQPHGDSHGVTPVKYHVVIRQGKHVKVLKGDPSGKNWTTTTEMSNESPSMETLSIEVRRNCFFPFFRSLFAKGELTMEEVQKPACVEGQKPGVAKVVLPMRLQKSNKASYHLELQLKVPIRLPQGGEPSTAPLSRQDVQSDDPARDGVPSLSSSKNIQRQPGETAGSSSSVPIRGSERQYVPDSSRAGSSKTNSSVASGPPSSEELARSPARSSSRKSSRRTGHSTSKSEDAPLKVDRDTSVPPPHSPPMSNRSSSKMSISRQAMPNEVQPQQVATSASRNSTPHPPRRSETGHSAKETESITCVDSKLMGVARQDTRITGSISGPGNRDLMSKGAHLQQASSTSPQNSDPTPRSETRRSTEAASLEVSNETKFVNVQPFPACARRSGRVDL